MAMESHVRVLYVLRVILFLDMNARFQSELCGSCHNLMMKAMSFNETVIAKVKSYRIHFFLVWVPMKL